MISSRFNILSGTLIQSNITSNHGIIIYIPYLSVLTFHKPKWQTYLALPCGVTKLPHAFQNSINFFKRQIILHTPIIGSWILFRNKIIFYGCCKQISNGGVTQLPLTVMRHLHITFPHFYSISIKFTFNSFHLCCVQYSFLSETSLENIQYFNNY